MNLHDIIEVEIKVRPTYGGRPARQSSIKLNGKRVKLFVAWLMDEDDKYPGEFALTTIDDETMRLFHDHSTIWLASGDVIEIESFPTTAGTFDV